MAFGTESGGVGVLDLESKKVVMAVQQAHDNVVQSVAFDKYGQKFASASTNVRIWNIDSCSAIGELRGHGDEVRGLNFSKELFITGSLDGSVRFWDNEGCCEHSASFSDALGGVYCVALIEDNNLLVVGFQYGAFCLWDVENKQSIGQPFYGHEGVIRSIAVSSDCRIIVTNGYDSRLMVWMWPTEENLRQNKPTLIAQFTLPCYAESLAIVESSGGNLQQHSIVAGLNSGVGLRFDIVP